MPPADTQREIDAENQRLFEVWRRSIPDARLRDRGRGQIPSPLGLLTPIFCMNCGRGCGYVYGSVQFSHALCDPCVERHGGIPGEPGRVGTVGPDGLVTF